MQGKTRGQRLSAVLTLLGFFMESVLLSVLSVLAALGEVRPLERKSSLVGEARPSGLAVCFLRPLRSVDICSLNEGKFSPIYKTFKL